MAKKNPGGGLGDLIFCNVRFDPRPDDEAFKLLFLTDQNKALRIYHDMVQE